MAAEPPDARRAPASAEATGVTPAPTPSERRVALEGTCNFRDLGGYATTDGRRVRAGVLFRSDNLSRLGESAHARLASLGLRAVVDLRTANERATRPNRLPTSGAPREVHLPISLLPELELRWTTREKLRFALRGGVRRLDGARLLQAYRELPTRAAAPLARMFELLLEPPGGPLLIMCMGGKDRTGFCAAMILTALGVPREQVLEDYLLTNTLAAARVGRLVRRLRLLTLNQVDAATLRPFLEARAEYLAAALDAIDARHGGVDAYLTDAAGLGPKARESLRAALLE